MTYQRVKLEFDGKVAVLKFNHPEVLNAIGARGPVLFDEYHHGYRDQLAWGLLPLPLLLRHYTQIVVDIGF